MAFKSLEKRREYYRNKQREYRADTEKNAKVNARRRELAMLPENREKVQKYNKQWRESLTDNGLTRSVEWQRERRKQRPADYLLFDAKRRAEKKKVTYEISDVERQRVEEVIASGLCEMSRLPFMFLTGTRNPYSPSIDRIKPELGYVDGNIRVILWALNMAMGEWGFETIRAIVDKVSTKP